MQIKIIDLKDNVAVAVQHLEVGEAVKVGDNEIILSQNISTGNKLAIKKISAGQNVIKYGNVIGSAIKDIEPGELVHTYNMRTALKVDEKYEYHPISVKNDSIRMEKYFYGYERGDDSVGIRNEIWIIPTVGCVNHIGRRLSEIANSMIDGSVDGVYCWEHPYGCSQMGGDQENTKKIIQRLCEHGNAGGILLLGLGCENLNLDVLGIQEKDLPGKIIKSFNCQDVDDEIEKGTMVLNEIINSIKHCERTSIPLTKLKVGVKCGGSDGFSGITANPLIGKTTDVMIEMGASVLMSEVPEMFGAERILMNRCRNHSVFDKLVNMINRFKNYYTVHNMPIYDNPSPGNKKGGITTLEEKSLGCIQKSGNSVIEDVCDYGEVVKAQGMNLVYAPGNDLVSMTALAAAGSHLLLFSTGRGTPVGAIVPTIKIASNTDLYNKKRKWIDYDAGRLICNQDMDESTNGVISMIQDVASGKLKTRNEENGERSFAIFKTGVTL